MPHSRTGQMPAAGDKVRAARHISFTAPDGRSDFIAAKTLGTVTGRPSPWVVVVDFRGVTVQVTASDIEAVRPA